MTNKSSLLVCGSLAYDEIFSYSGSIKDHFPDKSPDSLYTNIRAKGPLIKRGGCGGNIAWTTSLFSIPTVLFSWVGGDGGEYIRFLASQGVDTSQILTDSTRSTPRAILLSDNQQDQLLIFSSQVIPEGWKVVDSNNCELAIVTAGVPQKTIETVKTLKNENIPYIIDPGKFIMDISKEELQFCIDGADTLIVNSYEIELLIAKTGKDRTWLLSRVNRLIVTAGKDGSVVETAEGKEKIAAVVPPSLFDPYGAGDAFLGAYASGRFLGYSPIWSARFGAVTASFAIEEEGAQEHIFTGKAYLQRLQNTFGLPDLPLSLAYSSRGIFSGLFA